MSRFKARVRQENYESDTMLHQTPHTPGAHRDVWGYGYVYYRHDADDDETLCLGCAQALWRSSDLLQQQLPGRGCNRHAPSQMRAVQGK